MSTSELLTSVQGYLSANWLEIIGFASAIVTVWLTVRRNVWCWPTGIVCNVFFATQFVYSGLYGDAGLNVVYLLLGFYGWYLWLYGDPNRPRLPITHVPSESILNLVIVGLLGLVSLTYVLIVRTDSQVPLWDAAVTVVSLVAQWMLGYKRLENWLVWIVSNLLQFGLYLYKDLYLTAALQPLLIAMSIQGYLAWRRELLRTAS